MKTEASADVIVVGLGAMGSATLYQTAKQGGLRVLGLDRFVPPHDRGSSHGETRITRQAVGEGKRFAPFVLRSHEIWREIEEETGATLLETCGALILAPGDGMPDLHGKSNFLDRTIEVARQFGITHEVLDAGEIQVRFPQFRLRSNETGYFEPGGGFVHPERCIAAQLELAKRHGAQIRTMETVHRIAQVGDSVEVYTDRGLYRAARAIVTAGAWLPRLLGGELPAHLKVYRQTLHWFEADEAALYAPGRFPVFIWAHGNGKSDHFYGFPLLPGSAGVKLATELYETAADPNHLKRSVDRYEEHRMYETHVAGRLTGVGPQCRRSATCLYTVTADAGFVVDQLHDEERIMMVSACSGHGFKHSAAMGEALANLVHDRPSLLQSRPFPLARLHAEGAA
jgi:sarcosine oxidase